MRNRTHAYPKRSQIAKWAGLNGKRDVTKETSSKELTDKYIAEFCRINHLTNNHVPLTNKEI